MVKTDKKFKLKMPHTYVLIVCVMLFVALLTYILPAGKYGTKEVNGRKIIDAESYQHVEQTPVSLWDVVKAIPEGLNKAAGIIFMIYVISGGIEIVNATGALEASIGRTVKKFKDKTYIVMPLTLACFVALGAMGVGNSIVAFIPLGLMLAFNVGADALVGISLIGMGMNIGFSGGAFVASTVGTAHSLIGLPMFSGWEYRLVCTLILFVCGAVFITRYTMKIQKDPTASVVYGVEGVATQAEDVEMPELTTRRKLVLVAFLIGFGFVVYGAIKAWNANVDIPAIFLAMGIVCGLLAGFDLDRIAKEFVNGARKITFGALIVGIAAGIGVLLTKGQINDTVVHGLAGMLFGLPKVFSALVMYLINIIVNFFITSGSGQAAAVIPILSPIGDVLGLTQQTVVLAYQYGDGFTNQIMPMSSVLMASLAFANIPFSRWLKFVWRWLLINLACGGAFVVVATLMNLGPF
jgi:uncharacterized ion transporter superfamily protein YfcC